MAHRSLQDLQYSIEEAAERGGLPRSKSSPSLLQPPVGKKRFLARLTNLNSLKPWVMLCLLVLSLTILSKSFSYACKHNEQRNYYFAAADVPAATVRDNNEDLVQAWNNNEIIAVKNQTERRTVEEFQNEADALLLHAIEQLKLHSPQKTLPPLEALPSSPDSCAETTDSPKIAILFLTRGDLFHAPIWKSWFRSAMGVLPAEAAVAGSPCNSTSSSNTSIADADIIASQHLFNVYIHAPPNFNDFSPLWRNHLIQNRLSPTWGSADLVQASRFLMWEAFRDPSNTRFILLSESDLPLFHPLVLYRQIMSEERSRVNAWERPWWQVDSWRWTHRMAISPFLIEQSKWRKSSQWFSLIRDHVELILTDVDVFRGFEIFCKSGWDEDLKKWRDCYADEHYIPTLLAIHNREDETFEEIGSVAFADWSKGGAHPREYEKKDVSVELFGGKLGIDKACLTPSLDRKVLLERVEKTFILINGEIKGGNSSLATIKIKAAPPLKSTCFVTTRKFGVETVDAMLDNVFLRCGDDGLFLLNQDICLDAAAERAEQRRWAALMELA